LRSSRWKRSERTARGLALEIGLVLFAQHPVGLIHVPSTAIPEQVRSSGNPNKLGFSADRRILDVMASERKRARCRERLERLSESALDCESIQREAIADLRGVIGFDRWCWPFADSETLLPLSGVAEHDFGPRVGRALELEYSGDDFAAKDVLARRANSAGSLSAETGGDLARSPRWDEVMRPVGIGDIAAVACRDDLGCWGWIEAYRDGADRRFEDGDLELLASVGPSLGSALRRGLVVASKRAVIETSPPGVIVLKQDLSLVSSTTGARAWIDALPAAALFAGWAMLPAQVYPVATLSRSRKAATGAHALERAVDGRWVMIEGAPLEGDGDGQIAITLRSAAPTETFDLFCRAYAFTQRERDVAAGVVAGLDTRALTERLFISRHTVQDHLKSIFQKIGIHSRRQLLARFNASPDGR
jgi:DNA-binding CsgD family transcriptional regulator